MFPKNSNISNPQNSKLNFISTENPNIINPLNVQTQKFPSNNFQTQYQNIKNQPITPSIVETNGNKPLPRFGHTLVSISSVKLILFGGAVGDVRNYKCSNEIYIFNLMTKIWTKFNYNQNAIIPKERAAHAAASNNKNQMVIHGGSIGGSVLAEDELWLFDMNINKNNNNNNNIDINSNNDNNNKDSELGVWKLININGPSPGKRYGHTLTYMKQYFILIGGNGINGLSNDAWLIDIAQKELYWLKIQIDNQNMIPCPRLYHSSGICEKGNAKDILIVFGGRDQKEQALNDIWGLRKHRNGKWD